MIAQTPLLRTTKAYGQLLGRDFNPLAKLLLLRTSKPVILFGKDYWNSLINFDVLVEEGVITTCDRILIQYAETAEQAWNLILESYTVKGNSHST